MQAIKKFNDSKSFVERKFSCLLIIAIIYTPSSNVNAQVSIQHSKNIIAPELNCPAIITSNFKKNSSNIDPFEIPDDSDILEILQEESSQKYLDKNSIEYRKKTSIPSVGLWGDSHVAAHFFTDELIKLLAVDSNQVYQKFIPPTMGRAGVRLPVKKFCKSTGWNYVAAYKDTTNNSSRGLIELESSVPQSYLWVDFRKNSDIGILNGLKIPVSISSNTTKLGISIDDQEEQLIEINKSASYDYISIESKFSFSTIKLRLIAGQITIGGFVPIYNQLPKIYFDTFGIPGATMNGWSKMKKLDPYDVKDSNYYDVIILEYGTNEGNDANFDPNLYRKNLHKNLEIVRSLYPDSSCILVGPTDRGILIRRSTKKVKGKTQKNDLLKYSQRHKVISSIQEEEAVKVDCNFWDWQESMGGLGSSYKWLKQNPQLMSKDLIHLTVKGYQVSAQKFIDRYNLTKLIDKN